MEWGVTKMEIQNNHYGGCKKNRLEMGQTEREGQVQEAGAVISARDNGSLSWWWGWTEVGGLYTHEGDRMWTQWLRAQALRLNPDPAVPILCELEQVI